MPQESASAEAAPFRRNVMLLSSPSVMLSSNRGQKPALKLVSSGASVTWQKLAAAASLGPLNPK
jgi:hypothetical protein